MSASNRLRVAPLLVFAPLLALVAAPPAAAGGMTPEDVARLRVVTAAEISPDGRAVAYVLSVPRDPYDDDDGPPWTELHVATGPGQSRPFVAGEVRVSVVRFTPDGKAITFLAKRFGDEFDALWSIPLDGGESRKLAGFDTDITGYSLDPGGKRVALLAKDKQTDAEEKREKKGFTAKVVEEGLDPLRVWIAELKPDGPVKRDDARALPLEGSASELAWGPDGTRIAVALAPTPLIDDEYMKRKVHVVDTEGKVLGRIEHTGKLAAVRWSPDGARLALIAGADLNDPSPARLFVAPASGGAPVDRLPGFEGDVTNVAWKDAGTLAYTFDQGTGAGYAEIGASGTGKPVVRVGPAPGAPLPATLAVARDGRAAFVADAPRHPGELFVLGPRESSLVRWTESNPWLAEIDFGRQETISWNARDGLRIEGLLVRPLGERKGQRYPLIHVVHGGPESHFRDGWLTSYSNPGHVGAARGYAVLYANYRGSTGRGVAFSKLDQADYAGDPSGKQGGEFYDLVDGTEYLVGLGLVDRAKVGVTGGSYGGYASAWCATALTEHFAASVMFVGISDWVSKVGTTDIPNEMYEVHARRWPWDHWDWFRERSPLSYAKQARTPILILHGQDDTRVHPSQSLALYRYLKTLGQVPVRLVMYPGEGHGNRKAAARYDYSLRMLGWMDHYLKGPGGAPPPYELELDAEKLGLKQEDEKKSKE